MSKYWTQNVTMQLANEQSMPLPLAAVDDVVQYCIRICINYGSQLGASIVLFVVLLLLTKPDKRTSAVFWLNAMALLSNIARLVCQIIFFTTPFVKIYPYFTHDYTGVPTSAFANSVLGAVFVFFVVVFMEVSLVLQVQVVCSTFRRLYRRVLLVGSVLMALAPIALRLMLTVISSQHAVTLDPLGAYSNLESTTNIVVTVSICFFCTIFVVKLGFAIKLRKKLGVREFGPMKAIFVMGCQTMVIPGTFSRSSGHIREVKLTEGSTILHTSVLCQCPRTGVQRPHPRYHISASVVYLGRCQSRSRQPEPCV